MIGLWLGLVGAAGSERLHGLLHADAHHASHDCFITHFSKGQFLAVAGTVFVVVVAVIFFLPRRAEGLAWSVADVGLPSSRGPPSGSLFQ